MVQIQDKISGALARRIALAAQGFGAPRPTAVTAAHLRRTLGRLGLHQIDSVNVLARAHYLPAFSRLGPYDTGLLDRAAWGRKSQRTLFEYWAHEASLLPLALHPLLRWRMARAERGEAGWARLKSYALERRGEAEAVLERIRAEGAMAASDFEHGKSKSCPPSLEGSYGGQPPPEGWPASRSSKSGGWWEWGETKHALEYLFWSGKLTTATRRASFERVYDLAERVIPEAILALPTPGGADARRALVALSASALGVATASDLRDYFRLGLEESRTAIAALVEEGVLLPVAVEGWRQGAFLHAEARRPRRIEGQALLAPFDPLIWERARAERLFGFRYRIEIYTPAAKRVHGYYVLPFLMDEGLVARVDLKSDRQNGRLVARNIHLEPGAPAETRTRLAAELAAMAGWLGLEPPR
jgi:uncharacterized protein YcaQ